MIVKLLGLVDLLTAVLAVFAHIGFIPTSVLKIFAVYLIIKGAIFIKSFTSILDLGCGVYLLLMFFFNMHSFIVYLVALYLFQKAVFSMAT